jgi:hypothetical protein
MPTGQYPGAFRNKLGQTFLTVMPFPIGAAPVVLAEDYHNSSRQIVTSYVTARPRRPGRARPLIYSPLPCTDAKARSKRSLPVHSRIGERGRLQIVHIFRNAPWSEFAS